MDDIGALNRKFNDDPVHAMAPFDKNRCGTVPGEGGACLIVESLESAKKRGSKIYGEIVGYHSNNEAYHLSNPSPDGIGIMKCMLAAVKEAGIKNTEIDIVHTHATSTPAGDGSEANALKIFLGSDYEKVLKLSPYDFVK